MMRRQDQAAHARLFVAACCVVATGFILFAQSICGDTLTPQVQIDVKILEVDHSSERTFGINMRVGGTLAKLPPVAPNSSFPVGANFGLGQSPSSDVIGARLFPNNSAPGTLNLSGVLIDQEFQSILNSLSREKGVNIISAPTLITPNNETAKIDIGTSFNPLGVRLVCTPRIGADGTSIEMALAPEKGQKLILLGSGQTMVLGGYIQETKDAPPLTISQVPIVGGAMRNRTDVKKDLIMFITPQRVDALSHSPGGYQGGDPIKTETVGTGETIGHIGDLKLQNQTGQPLLFIIQPFIFESKGGKNQASACPYLQNVALAAKETKIVPVNGICLEQKKAAVANGVTGELIMNTGDSTVQDPDLRIPSYKVKYALRLETKIYETVGEMAKHGAFKEFPFDDKDEQTRIALQWCTWSHPRLAEVTGSTPATKEDMKTVVKKQQKNPVTPATEKKIDKGVDAMWEKIELAGAKAKDVEKADEPASQPTPTPQT